MPRAKRENKEDARLVDKAKKDKEEFGNLYLKYFSRVQTYISRRIGQGKDSAEDLTQETFVRAFRNIGKFHVRGYSYLTYLLRISRNLLLNFYRKPKEAVLLEELAKNLLKEEKGIEREIDEKFEAKVLKQAIAKLPREDQELLRLYYNHELSLKEIARRRKKTENAMKLQLARVRKKLLKSLLATPVGREWVSTSRKGRGVKSS